jgi:carbamoyl-phosphate synthase large subunit
MYYRGTPVVCPAKISDSDKDRIGEVARAAFRTIVNQGYARVDMRLDQAGVVNVLEVNPRASRTVPFISKATGVPWAKIAAR